MIFIINNEGTTTSAVYENVYQGSNNANRIVLLAPFASTSQVTVSFKLPNGQVSEPRVMSLLEGFDRVVLDALAEGKSLNAWYASINSHITQYAGVVDVQFTLHTGNEKVQNTYPSSFEVIASIPTALPETPDADIYEQILDHLATLAINFEESADKAISHIKYVAPENYLLNRADEADVTLSVVPEGALLMYPSDFTLSGMTAYLDESNIHYPAVEGNDEKMFLQFMPKQTENTGFIINLGSNKDVGVVQLYVYNVSHDTTIEAYTSIDGENYTFADSASICKATGPNVLSIVPLSIKKNSQYIKIVETSENLSGGNIIYKGVEVYNVNKEAQFEIKQKNGSTSTIDLISGNIINKVTQSEYDSLIDKTGIYFVTVGE